VVRLTGGLYWFQNTPGCVDLVAGAVALEPTSCGNALWERYDCVENACDSVSPPNPACTITLDASTCEEAALLTVCKPYDDAVHDGRCASLIETDGGPSSLVAPCFPDPAIADPSAQLVALSASLEKLFCGPL
jgi:hypothetical protein